MLYIPAIIVNSYGNYTSVIVLAIIGTINIFGRINIDFINWCHHQKERSDGLNAMSGIMFGIHCAYGYVLIHMCDGHLKCMKKMIS